MIRTVIFDIGNVLAGFAWHEYYEKLGFDAAMADRLGRATVLSGDWNEYDRGCMSDEAIVSLFVENDPEIEAEIRQAVSSITGIMTHYGYAVDWVKELKRIGYWYCLIYPGKYCRNAGLHWISSLIWMAGSCLFRINCSSLCRRFTI